MVNVRKKSCFFKKSKLEMGIYKNLGIAIPIPVSL